MLAILLGVLFAAGVLLMASVFVGTPQVGIRVPRWWLAWSDQIIRSRITWLTPWRLVAVSIIVAIVVGLAVGVWTRVWVVSITLMALSLPALPLVVAQRARAHSRLMQRAWPDVVDTLVSGVRAGAGLPDLLCELAVSGPEVLRPHFSVFVSHYRAHGKFSEALDRVKERCADPVADRIIEALRLAREVGGADLGVVLRDLGVLLREEARTRGELEARQSWTVNAARLAVVAPWLVLVMVSAQPGAAAAWNTPHGAIVLFIGAVCCAGAYGLMHLLGRLPTENRGLR